MRNKSVVWIPVLLVGAMVYWTLALGFGGLSLVSLTAELPLPAGDAPDSYQSITVNLTESPEQQGQDEGPTVEQTGVSVDLVPAGDIPRPNAAVGEGGLGGIGDIRLSGGSRRTGPGNTAF